jgi:glyoxylate carboligase
MKASDYIVSFLISKNITDVFGYPGGMVTHLIDSFDKYKGEIAAHVNYHEQASSFCACGYAQVSNKSGCAYATSGPGATNLITGIANAYFDSMGRLPYDQDPLIKLISILAPTYNEITNCFGRDKFHDKIKNKIKFSV